MVIVRMSLSRTVVITDSILVMKLGICQNPLHNSSTAVITMAIHATAIMVIHATVIMVILDVLVFLQLPLQSFEHPELMCQLQKHAYFLLSFHVID